ncbi:hypothetical protein NXS19_002037 [Fusarium pseudograminearum]|nr:hypothetical protein NXS19_002037 [Fusarium pseudograminearum]
MGPAWRQSPEMKRPKASKLSIGDGATICPKGPERSPQAALFLDPQDDCCVPHCTIGRRPTSQPFSGRPETENALLGTKWCIHVHWVATVAAIHRTFPSDKQTRPRIGCYPE